MNRSIVIAGAAGDGINTLSEIIEKTLLHHGYHVYSYKNYMSRVRGGYNFTTIRFGEELVHSTVEKADLLIAINQEAVDHTSFHLKSGGIFLSTIPTNLDGTSFIIDMARLKKEVSNKKAYILAFAGACFDALGIEWSKENIQQMMHQRWGDLLAEDNYRAFEIGTDCVHRSADNASSSSINTPAITDALLVSGNQSIALGAVAAGMGFYSAYPMAPSSSILQYLASIEQEMHLVIEQAEDEIAAAISAIGASANGVRSMTGTSGGGFSLMVESIGFSAIAEVPLVMVNVQRPGPATGLPTRTAQADFSFVSTASPGEFTRIVLAPTSVEDCFYITFRAFQLADKYRCPVIILSDQALADAKQSIPPFQVESLTIERYIDEVPDMTYQHYYRDCQLKSRAIPKYGQEPLLMTDTHIHDHEGFITEDPDITNETVQRFLWKSNEISKELYPPTHYQAASPAKATLVCWGSTSGAVIDAIKQSEQPLDALLFSDLFPLDSSVLKNFKGPFISVEANATHQFSQYLSNVTGIQWRGHISKYDGRPFTATYILDQVKELL